MVNFLIKIQNLIDYKLRYNNFYCWHFIRKKEYYRLESILYKNYYRDIQNKKTSIPKKIICIFDGRIRQGGLADRLRGIISTYLICKKLNLEFKILFNHPFNLSDYLIPNNIDWEIESNNIDYNLYNSTILFLNTQIGNEYEMHKQKKWLTKKIKNLSNNEIHVLTNALFSYKYNYSELFNELFKLSPRLENTLCKFTSELGNDYISVSCRFLDLLGDFNETSSSKQNLSQKEKDELILANIKQIYKLHEKEPNKKILVNSDSKTFLNAAQKIDFTYIIEGNITHIDNSSNSSYETYEKTFIDFFMISRASEIFLFKTSLMHNSGYPYAASLIYNKPFHIINF